MWHNLVNTGSYKFIFLPATSVLESHMVTLLSFGTIKWEDADQTRTVFYHESSPFAT